ncbi:MAG: hypothetical protein LAT75_01730 [Candidatus Cyclonatronum sp.]|uniref:hypothetical protein n=1 Tax=Cyclonatronum sp. TaxID=3024185 RepID=UPI0025B936D3|nr:hypothetical protein [Cyclonatronum sp.]MCC5933164.1 hypothetical protein [Balneolales bacterium]MCH8485552.1 hypothetical protein [Cyclonatronum sp.]
MTNGIKLIKGALFTLLLSALFYLSGCDITDPLDGIKVILDTKERETTVSVIFRDASTNEPIGFSGDQNVTITLTGTDEGQVIDLLSRERNSFESRRGFVSFAIRDGRTPSRENPVELVAQVSAPSGDFIATTQRLFVNTVGSNAFEIRMVNKNTLPQGVNGASVAAITTVSSGGGTVSDVVLSGEQLGMQTPLTIRIPQGTRLFNANGTALNGELSAEVFHFNHKERESLQSFPGGLAGVVSNFDEISGIPGGLMSDLQTEGATVHFTPAGFMSVSFTIGGQLVRTADGLMEFIIGLPEGVFNRSGERVMVGSSVPIWSYDRDLGEWTFEFEAQVMETPADDPDFGPDFPPMYILGQTNHWSFWNAAYASPVCKSGVQVNLTGLQMPAIGRLLRTDTDENVFMGLFPSEVASDGSRFIELTNVPEDIPGRLEILDLFNNVIAEVDIPQLCNSEPVNLDLGSVSETVITFSGTGICPGKDVELRPNIPILIKPDTEDGQWLHVGNTRQGRITLGIPEPGTYLFGTYFENRWYEYNVDLSGFNDGDVHEETIELPDNICRDL